MPGRDPPRIPTPARPEEPPRQPEPASPEKMYDPKRNSQWADWPWFVAVFLTVLVIFVSRILLG
jgi:hypothetical protein